MEQENYKYLNKFNKIFPWFNGFSADLLFYVAINTLFYTLIKGFSAQQIVFLTTISSIISICLRIPLIKVVRKIGNTYSVRLGMGLLLISSILITFGNSYMWIIFGNIAYELAFIFKKMEDVMLKNNLAYQKRDNDYVKIRNKSTTIYSIITAIIAFASGFLFNLNAYLPMYLCIFFCIVCFLISLTLKDVSNNNIVIDEKKKEKSKDKVKLSKIIMTLIIAYGIFFSLIALGQQNSKLFIQYSLSDFYASEKMASYLGIIVAISRIARVLANISFQKIYNKFKDKVIIILSSMLICSFLFMIIGHFINNYLFFKFLFMSLGFFIILAIRDPFQICIYDLALKFGNKKDHQIIFSYFEFAKKLCTMFLSIIVSSMLTKLDMIFVIIILAIISIIELNIILRLYKMIINNKENILNKSNEMEKVC